MCDGVNIHVACVCFGIISAGANHTFIEWFFGKQRPVEKPCSIGINLLNAFTDIVH